MSLIYKATNLINGKCYIGLTVRTIEQRTYRHLKESYNEKSSEYNLVFHRAIRKYKPENFKWEIIKDNIDDFEYLKEQEIFYIKKHNTFFKTDCGYNMTMGGDGSLGWKHSKETKKKMSKNHADVSGKNNPMFGKERTHSQKTKNKMSESLKGDKHPQYGMCWSKERREKTINAIKEAWKSGKYKRRKHG